MRHINCDYCHRPAELVTGKVVYPHRPDLLALKFWHCSNCGAYVGCHKAGAVTQIGARRVRSDGTLPLGRLADAKLRAAKQRAHDAFDPLWRSGYMGRRQAYAWLAEQLGISVDNCHIGMFDLPTCWKVPGIVHAHRVEMAQPRKETTA